MKLSGATPEPKGLRLDWEAKSPGTYRGKILVEGTRNTDDIIVADLDLDLIREVRNTWQFYRDRRPETYGQITAL